jgi:hypothetical protein
MAAGRPDEGRVRMNVHVLPAIAKKVSRLVDKDDPEMNTQGKVIDRQFARKRASRGRGAREKR